MFGMPNITEIDGTIPPSWPHKDFALGIPASNSPRRFAAPGALPSIDSSKTTINVRHAEHDGGRRNDPALMAAQGRCPRHSSVELTSPFRRFRSVAVNRSSEPSINVRHAEHDGGRRNDPALVAAQGLCPRSAMSSCARRVHAGETDIHPVRTASPRPLHEFPHGAIKQKTSAVETRSRLSRCSACRTPRNRTGQRGEFGTQRILGGTIEWASASPRAARQGRQEQPTLAA